MALERRLPSAPCPRECGGKIFSGDRAYLNATSKLDEKQVCTSCFVNEMRIHVRKK